jgi:hypothetical protein
MKLLFENWRKFLVEQPTIRGLHDTDWTAISEDDLYDYSYDDLIGTRDEINKELADMPAGIPPSAHAGYDLLPTINARIEAIEESEAEDTKAQIEGIYSGEYAMKLARAFMGSSKQGIDLASMIPDTESLVEEFKKLRGLVQKVLGYAERSDMAPWTKWGWGKHPRAIEADTFDLIDTLTDLPGENVPDMNELVDERKEIRSIYDLWSRSIRDLENYAFWQLASPSGRYPPGHRPARRQDLIDSYHFIKKWVGEE